MDQHDDGLVRTESNYQALEVHHLDRSPRSELVNRAMARTEEVFDRLKAYSYLSPLDRGDFSYYRSFYHESLLAIDTRITDGSLIPVNLSDFPQVVRFPGYHINAALFIGSFDPFQMTHLATALRYLATPDGTAPVVFVVPEGYDNPSKPQISDYRYRFDLLSMQLKDIFEPFIVPLDIGEGADTIEIVRRFIAMFPGAHVSMTHLLGSDVLPLAVRWLPVDLKAWRAEAGLRCVDFSYEAFVVHRNSAPPVEGHINAVRAMNLPIQVDDKPVEAPSSTDFRDNHAFSIVFPTESVIRHMEVLFRYNLNRPWSACCLPGAPPQA